MTSAVPQGLEDRRVRSPTDFYSNLRQTNSLCLTHLRKGTNHTLLGVLRQ